MFFGLNVQVKRITISVFDPLWLLILSFIFILFLDFLLTWPVPLCLTQTSLTVFDCLVIYAAQCLVVCLFGCCFRVAYVVLLLENN